VATSLTPFPYRLSTVTNISPLTYRDAETFLDELESLKHWLTTVNIPEVETILAGILADAQTGVENAEATVTEAKQGWNTLFEQFMVNVVAEIRLLNESAFSQIVADVNSGTHATILGLINAAIESFLNTDIANLDATLRAKIEADIATAINAIEAKLTFDPLAPWKNAVQNQKISPAIYVNLGDSIANGGNATTWARNWLWRFTARYTDRQPYRLDAGTLTPAPSNGVAVYTGSIGGLTAANYLSDALVARLGILQPDLVTHIVGTNDWAQGVNPLAYRLTLKTWLNKIKAVSEQTVHVLIHVPQRLDGFTNAYQWSDYKEQLVSLADEFGSKVVVLDVDAEFRKYGSPGSTDFMRFWDTDNLHFHNDGNKMLADTIANFVGAPRIDVLPREIERGLTVPPGSVSTNTTVSSFIVKPKPYLREGIVLCNVFSRVNSGDGDLILSYNPTGLPDADYQSFRIGAAGINHSAFMYVSLEPHTEYTIKLVAETYAGNTITFGGTGKFFNFIADLSPV